LTATTPARPLDPGAMRLAVEGVGQRLHGVAPLAGVQVPDHGYGGVDPLPETLDDRPRRSRWAASKLPRATINAGTTRAMSNQEVAGLNAPSTVLLFGTPDWSHEDYLGLVFGCVESALGIVRILRV